MTTKTRPRRRTRPAKPTPTVNLRKPLPTRPQTSTTPGITPTEQAEIRAALAATSAGIRIPVLAWHATSPTTALYSTPRGGHIHHDPNNPTPFTAYTPCARGTHHATPITNQADLTAAAHEADHCPGHGHAAWPDQIRLTPVMALGADPNPESSGETTQPLNITTLNAPVETRPR